MSAQQIPPELMAALGGGGPPQGAPSPQGGGNPDDQMKQALDALQAALQAEPDDERSAKMAALVKGLYDILASSQNEQMKAMGGQPGQMRAMAKAYGG